VWYDRNVVAESGVVYLVNENAEESGGLFIWIRLKLGVDLDNEGRSNGGKQTSLLSESGRVRLTNAEDSRISGRCSGPRHTSL